MIRIYYTPYASLNGDASLFCVRPEDLDNILALEGARATKLTDGGYPVVSIKYDSLAWEATTQEDFHTPTQL